MEEQKKINLVRELSQRFFKQGYNCAQSVYLGVYQAENRDIDPAILKVGAGFTRGLGTGEICGAVIGGVITLGLDQAEVKSKPNNKKAVKSAKELQKNFLNKYSTLNCRQLLDSRSPDYKKAHDFCCILVQDCAEITYQLMK